MSLNNNKRDIDSPNTDVRNNKKQKLDNDNSDNDNDNSVNDGAEIDITNLEKKTVAQLKDIATSLGVTIKSSTRKNDILEKVKEAYKAKQDILAKQEIDSNINSFNKAVVEFTIKDGIDPSEWLFWKVFRNKFIYKRIMSNMDKRLTSEYDSIISVIDMLKYKKIGMIRDKVLNGHYLTFGGLNIELDENTQNFNSLNQIFTIFKQDDDQDRLFYKQLFKHYGSHIFNFSAVLVNNEIVSDTVKGREQLVNQLITVKCLPALQILVQEYQYKPTQLNLQHSLKYGLLEFIKLTLQQQPKLKESIIQSFLTINPTKPTNNQQQQQQQQQKSSIPKSLLPEPIKTPIIKPNLFKSINWLHNENLIDINSTSTGSSKSKDKDNLLLRIIKLNEYEIDETISVKSLITICKLILSSADFKTKIITNTEDIESFSNSLSKQELKLQLSDPSFQIQNKKEFIIKLVQLYYSFCNVKSKPEFYFLYFNGSNGNNDNYGTGNDNGNFNKLVEYQNKIETDLSRSIDNLLKLSFQFANYELLQHTIKTYNNEKSDKLHYHFQNDDKMYRFIKDFIQECKDTNFIFSHCTGVKSHEKKINFINSIITNINFNQKVENQFITKYRRNIPSSNSNPGIMGSNLLFYLLVAHNDIELVKLFIKELDNEIKFVLDAVTNVSSFIHSTEMLEYIFYFHRDSLKITSIWYFNSIELLKHYESLYKEHSGVNNNQIIVPYPYSRIIFKLPLLTEIVKQIIYGGGPTVYTIDTNSHFKDIIDSCIAPTNEKFEMFKYYFTNFIYPSNSDSSVGDLFYWLDIEVAYSTAYMKFLDWLVENYNDLIIQKLQKKQKETITADGSGNGEDEVSDEDEDKEDIINISLNNNIYFKTRRLNMISFTRNSYLNGYIDNLLEQVHDIPLVDFTLKALQKVDHQLKYHHIKILYREAARHGHLKVFQHIYNHFNWLLNSSSLSKKKKGNSNDNDNSPILDTRELKEILLITLSNNHLKCAEFLFGILPAPTIKEFKSQSSNIVQLYFKNKYQHK